MSKKIDWLNEFIEKNAWSLLVALILATTGYAFLKFEVQANEDKIHNIEQAQIIIIDNQKAIIKLQVNQDNLAQDINEIKEDVKLLLRR